MDYITVKWLHILSSTVLFGTGIGSAFYMLSASLRGDPRSVWLVVKHVVIADWIFTTPAVIVQPLTGFYLAHLAGLPFAAPWIAWSSALYLLAGACWIPVVWMQIRMRDMAHDAAQTGKPLPPRYRIFLRAWILLGIVAFVSLVVVFYLMVAKPV